MDSRAMLIAFEDLLRTTNPDLQYDKNIDTKIVYDFLTRAQEEYISAMFLAGDSIQDNINAVRKRSDVLRKLIKRTDATVAAISTSKQGDGGYLAKITETDYWMFLSGVLLHSLLPNTNNGSTIDAVELDLINHYDLQNKIRTINNEPILTNVPIVLEGDDSFVLYLDKDYSTLIEATITNTTFNIIYLAFPDAITGSVPASLAVSTHNDIVKLAVDIYIAEYKYKLKQPQQAK